MSERGKCVILVPANYGIEPDCERALGQLERAGYPVWRIPGFANIDQCRNEVAMHALDRGFEELFWIDSDVAFQPEAVERLRAVTLAETTSAGEAGSGTTTNSLHTATGSRRHVAGQVPRPADGTRSVPATLTKSAPAIVSAIYPKKGQRSLASRLLPETKEVHFGVGGGLIEILYAATGFLLTRREVYETIRERCKLAVCNQQWGKPTVPYFMPMVIDTEQGPWYLGDDFSFCHRARQAGYKIYADTTIRLGHIGPYAFSWEDVGGSNQRFGTYIYRVLDSEA